MRDQGRHLGSQPGTTLLVLAFLAIHCGKDSSFVGATVAPDAGPLDASSDAAKSPPKDAGADAFDAALSTDAAADATDAATDGDADAAPAASSNCVAAGGFCTGTGGCPADGGSIGPLYTGCNAANDETCCFVGDACGGPAPFACCSGSATYPPFCVNLSLECSAGDSECDGG